MNGVSGTVRGWSAAAWLVPVVGPVLALLAGGHSLSRHHALQSLVVSAAAVGVFLAWAAVAWMLTWLPIVGATLGAMLFAAVPLVLAATLVAHISGLVYAWQGRFTLVPLYGGLLRAVLGSAD